MAKQVFGAAQSLEHGVIGNCAVAALIDADASINWLCLPRLDGDTAFNALLGGRGQFAIDVRGLASRRQRYLRNTAVLETILEAQDGSQVRVIDFAPRFTDRGRTFRPASIVRIIEPLRGAPFITTKIAVASAAQDREISPRRGVSHLCYSGDAYEFRITTNAPLSFVAERRGFVLDHPVYFILTPDEPLSAPADQVASDWLQRTTDHWRSWSRRLATPPEWQDAVIRAAITLKLCLYEETGGVVAALTTSIPEHAGSARNWDYRFCWLRDAYFTVGALNRLSAVGTLEQYLRYLRNVVAMSDGGHIQPVYGVALEQDLSEQTMSALPGYRDHRPVRFGNQAAEHIQHDVYGHVILGAAQAFFDERLLSPAGALELTQFKAVGERAFALYDTPDAGIWEYRGRAEVHTSSAFMCWAACDRLAKISQRLGATSDAEAWAGKAAKIRSQVLDAAWNEERRCFTGAFGGADLDASVLLMAEVGFLDAGDPRYVATVERINDELRDGAHVFRYRIADDFGAPKTAFTACTFWLIDALARIGRVDEARAMFEEVLRRRTRLGLLSEDLDVATGELWGNFPQTYSMVGIINSAARLSRPWDSVA